MNILFLTIGALPDINASDIYADMLRHLRDLGHRVCVVYPHQSRSGQETSLHTDSGIQMLGVRIGNITQCGLVEKGISTLMIEPIYKNAIRKYFPTTKFDLVLYTTPPITLAGAVAFVKKRDGAVSYLLLKDIFPQNAVDLGMMTTKGPKSVIYRMFRAKEKKLYAVSDHIGCMSPANVKFVLEQNPRIPAEKAEVCPNSIDAVDLSVSEETRMELRQKYGIPQDKTVFVYGGNLGKPQGIPFLIECLKAQKDNDRVFFLIVGSGTEYETLEQFTRSQPQKNVKLLARLPKEDYDRMVPSCDVGLIFLDHRFTIPNFPSRLLSYMQAKIPVLAVTDPNTDVGVIARDNGFGWSCSSGTAEEFSAAVESACHADRAAMGERAWEFMNQHYSTEAACRILLSHLPEGR